MSLLTCQTQSRGSRRCCPRSNDNASGIIRGGVRKLDSTIPQNHHQQTCTTPHANRKHARKSWRSDVPIILPGWRHHTGGSQSTPTVHPCLAYQGDSGWLTAPSPLNTPTATTNEPRTLCTRPNSRADSQHFSSFCHLSTMDL